MRYLLVFASRNAISLALSRFACTRGRVLFYLLCAAAGLCPWLCLRLVSCAMAKKAAGAEHETATNRLDGDAHRVTWFARVFWAELFISIFSMCTDKYCLIIFVWVFWVQLSTILQLFYPGAQNNFKFLKSTMRKLLLHYSLFRSTMHELDQHPLWNFNQCFNLINHLMAILVIWMLSCTILSIIDCW